MASACLNSITMSPDKFPASSYPSYSWLSPRISFSREDDPSKHPPPSSDAPPSEDPPQPEIQDPIDFEFRLEYPVAMLPADELFSDGKLVPLYVTNMRPSSPSVNVLTEMRSPETAKTCRRMELEISSTDTYLFSPKAPRCSSRWKELLGLKKLYQKEKTETQTKTTPFLASSKTNPKSSSLKHFLHRSSKCCNCNSSSAATSLDHTLRLPLLRDSDCESVSISSSRLSLSSSCSSHEHEDLPRLSLDSEKPNVNANPFFLNRNPPRMKTVKPRSESNAATTSSSSTSGRVGRSPMRSGAGESSSSGSTSRGVSVDSPRMNSSGKIVFQSLERSSSSPSSFNGGPRYKHRGMERSYSANVRVTPVLNVPVCSLRGTSKSVSVFGFGQLFSSSPQKRDASSSSSSSSSSAATNKTRNRTTDRT